MKPELAKITEFLQRLGHPPALVARKPHDKSGRTTVVWPAESGDDAANIAAGLAVDHDAIYVNLNPLTPETLNAVYRGASVRDVMIERRTRLLIDVDGSGDLNEAHRQIVGLRQELGEPLTMASTGNGFNMLYPIDLPNTPATTRQVTEFLQRLKQRFPMLDTTVASASRLTRIIGTLNRSKVSGERVCTFLL